jgi:hypothetical protein
MLQLLRELGLEAAVCGEEEMLLEGDQWWNHGASWCSSALLCRVFLLGPAAVQRVAELDEIRGSGWLELLSLATQAGS